MWREVTDVIITRKNTQAEKEMILRRYPYYKNDMTALWDSLRKSGYTRSYCGMLRVIKKWVSSEIKSAQSASQSLMQGLGIQVRRCRSMLNSCHLNVL